MLMRWAAISRSEAVVLLTPSRTVTRGLAATSPHILRQQGQQLAMAWPSGMHMTRSRGASERRASGRNAQLLSFVGRAAGRRACSTLTTETKAAPPTTRTAAMMAGAVPQSERPMKMQGTRKKHMSR